jgi:hypothetical protein
MHYWRAAFGKLFKYAGAASRLSGSQNAVSSFALTGSNADAKDIVTDGASLWVVNDTTTDKVFKYSVAGSLLGSWTIGSVNSKPTGLTIDPANVSDIWIVDSGTDLVYQYVGAASRISGSQVAASTYALAAGNTNPQGIADPPRGLGREPVTSHWISSSSSVGFLAFTTAGSDVTFDHSVNKAPKRKSEAALAHHAVFENFAPQTTYLSVEQAPQCKATITGPELPELNVDNDHQTAVDLAFESALESVI